VKLTSGELAADVHWEGETAVIEGRRGPFRVSRRDGEIIAIETDGRIFAVRAIREGRRALVWFAGRAYELHAASTAPRSRESAGDLLAPMPGLIRRVEVSAGSPVARGQVLMVLEAMKMEHAIRAPRDGVIRRIAYGEGDLVEAGTPLVELA
jgi:3-methylcrotonyl-CoA carboxylase alpha subunit